MTHPTLAKLTLDEIHERGVHARRMGVPYFGASPFVADSSIKEFDVGRHEGAGGRRARAQ